MPPRTRFAPSPTGYLHIGGVRTALFNWLYARRHGGQFILRIDDTDQGRNQREALQPILDGFKWLGLNWDEGPEIGGPYGPYYQSQKLPRYQEAVRQLLDKGLAYWDYATPEEMKAEREAAEKEKRPYLYSRRWMAESDADRKRFEAEGRKGAVKIKMPREGVCTFQDHVRGEMAVEWAGEQDTVIQRSDGTVTYNLANVVDDFDMKISHVIRAEEHLSNTPRQIFMLEGLGYPRPEYAHVPFVAEPGSKNKLSKRKIVQYLKNPDFKKVYEHARSVWEMGSSKEAFDFAATVKYALFDLSKTQGIVLTAENIQDVLQGIFLRVIKRHLKLDDSSATKMFFSLISDRVDDILADPSYLESYEYGKHILAQLAPIPPAESFNPVLVDFYKQVGYLPAALLNYLVLLGWATEDNREDFTIAQMVEEFSLDRVVKAPASLDVKKLFAFQARYMQALPVVEKADLVMPFLMRAGLVTDAGAARPFVMRVVNAAGPRLTVAGDILEYDYLFLPDDRIGFDPSMATKHLAEAFKKKPQPNEPPPPPAVVPPLAEVLPKLRAVVAAAEPFTHDTLKAATEALAMAEGAKAGPLSQVLRIATTGKEVGFSAYDTLALLGRDRCLARIDRAMKRM